MSYRRFALALMLTMPVVTTIQMLTSIDSRVTVGQGSGRRSADGFFGRGRV
jgi:hypothetical protein